MSSPLGTGILYGLILTLSTGPSFFYLIKVGIEKGFRKAMLFALGIFVSDLILLTLIFLGLRPLFENMIFRQAFSLTSGILIVVFGLTMLLKRKIERPDPNQVVKDLPYFMYAVKGIGVNLFNPFTIVLWVGILGTVSPKPDEFVWFVIGILGVVLSSDILKAYLAKLIGTLMTPKAVFLLNRILGIAFILIGLYFIFLFYGSFVQGHDINIDVPSLN